MIVFVWCLVMQRHSLDRESLENRWYHFVDSWILNEIYNWSKFLLLPRRICQKMHNVDHYSWFCKLVTHLVIYCFWRLLGCGMHVVLDVHRSSFNSVSNVLTHRTFWYHSSFFITAKATISSFESTINWIKQFWIANVRTSIKWRSIEYCIWRC